MYFFKPAHAFLGNNDEHSEHNRYDRLFETVNSPAIMIQIEDKIEDPTDKLILKTMLKFTRVSFKIMVSSRALSWTHIKECLNQNPHERPTAENVCKEFLMERWNQLRTKVYQGVLYRSYHRWVITDFRIYSPRCFINPCFLKSANLQEYSLYCSLPVLV